MHPHMINQTNNNLFVVDISDFALIVAKETVKTVMTNAVNIDKSCVVVYVDSM